MTKFLQKFMVNWMILIFEIVNFPFLDGDVPRSPSYDVLYIFLSIYVLQDWVLMLLNSTTKTYF